MQSTTSYEQAWATHVAAGSNLTVERPGVPPFWRTAWSGVADPYPSRGQADWPRGFPHSSREPARNLQSTVRRVSAAEPYRLLLEIGSAVEDATGERKGHGDRMPALEEAAVSEDLYAP
jgi:hypothetical protein